MQNISTKRTHKLGLLRLYIIVIGLVIISANEISFAQGLSFDPPINFSTGRAPSSVVIGDFNSDSKPDLAVANLLSNNVSILLGSGSGTFGIAINFAVGSYPTSIAIDDFNGDGKQDLAVLNIRSNNVSILLNNGTNSLFGTVTNFSVGFNPVSLATSDFNNDGRQDLAVVNEDNNTVSILLGIGNGSFSLANDFYAGGRYPRDVAIGDFNGDGIQDLGVTNPGTSNISILLGIGDGTFNSATNYALRSYPTNLAVADINGDEKLDVVVENKNSSVTILLGKGDGSLNLANEIYVGRFPLALVISDFNGDGMKDLVVTIGGEIYNVLILLGVGDGTFGRPLNFTAGLYPTSVTIGDLNIDGKTDIAVANEGNNNVSIFLNTTIITHTITSTSGANGIISPLGAVSVNNGDNQTFTITPSTGYIVNDVLVDAISVGTVTNYTFSNVTEDHTILVTFKISSSAMKLAAKDLLIPYLTNSNKKVRKAAKKAIKHIGKSLEPKLWADVNHLTKKGGKVFEEEKHAVKDLIKNDKEKDDDKKSKDKSFTPPFSTDVLSAINYLLTADKNLAQTAIDDAVAAGGKTKEIDKANKEMAKVLVETGKNKYAKAIDHYKKAWEHAQKAGKDKDDDEDDDKDDESIANNNENISIDNTSSIPVDFSLSQNYPNPFNPNTVIQFGIPETGFYTLNVYNTLGQEVARLVNGQLASGNYRINFDASKLSTGIYIYTIRGNNVNISRKMILMK